MKIFTIIHRGFSTDTMIYMESHVPANSKEEAVYIFNKFIDDNKNHRLWCYYDYKKVSLENCNELKLLTDLRIK